MRLAGVLLKISYDLRRHQWMGAPLDRWLAVFLVIVAGLMAIRWLPGGRSGVLVCASLLVLLLVAQYLAGRRDYLVFQPEDSPGRLQAELPMMGPMDKLLLRASGRFEVEGKEQSFTELQAYFRSFETREHAVMAIVPPSLYLAIGRWPDHEIGMWYMFFKNGELRQVQPGNLLFGTQQRLALRLQLEQTILPETSPLDVWGGYRSGKAKPKIRPHTIYLSFDNPQDRQTVMDDLLADAFFLSALLT